MTSSCQRGTLRRSRCIPFHLVGLVAVTAGLLAAQPAAAQTWTATDPASRGAMLALDAADNSFVAGSDANGGLLAKYGPNGVLLWQSRITDLVGRLVPSWVTVDAGGNAVVTARYVDAAGSPNGLYVVRYSPTGQRTTQDMITGLPAYALRGATDALGNIYVLGGANLANASGATTPDIVTFKLGANGLRQWIDTYGFDAASGDFPASMAVTPDGRLYVGGQSGGQMLLLAYDAAGNRVAARRVAGSGGAAEVVVDPASGAVWAVGATDVGGAGGGFLVIKHDAQLNELWRLVVPARGGALRAAVDTAGNLFVTGAVDTNTGQTQVILYDWLTLKIDPNGTLLWSRSVGQPFANNDVPNALAVDADGSVVVTGEGRTVATATTPSVSSMVTVRYRADGSEAWSYNSAAAVPGVAVRVGSSGDAFVLGAAPQTLVRYPKSLAPVPTALSLGSASVVGGNSLTATVTVSGPAGTTVALASSLPSVAGVPSSVVIPAGRSSASFRITTYRVKVDRSVTLTASAGGGSMSAVLLVRRR